MLHVYLGSTAVTECAVFYVRIFLAISYTFLDHLSHNCGQSSS